MYKNVRIAIGKIVHISITVSEQLSCKVVIISF